MGIVTLSPNGVTRYAGQDFPTELLVATANGVVRLIGTPSDPKWTVGDTSLAGVHIGSLMRDPVRHLLFAGAHQGELYRSGDSGRTWEPSMNGIGFSHIYCLAYVGDSKGGVELYAGTEPAYLYRSTDFGSSWQELSALRRVPGTENWNFPPPPHIAHVKHVTADPRDRRILYVCIEQGALLKSEDWGETFQELNFQDESYSLNKDTHRVVFDPFDPDHFYLPSGDGVAETFDSGETWVHSVTTDMRVGYPDAFFCSPTERDVLFAAGGGWNPFLMQRTGNARSAIVRSKDGGKHWQQLQGGLPSELLGNIEAMTMVTWETGYGFFAGTTDGEVFASFDKGVSWRLIADNVGPVSKGGHYLVLEEGRRTAAHASTPA